MFGAIFRFVGRFGPWVLLAFILFLVAIVLTGAGAMFGFSLDDVDRWLEANGGFFHAVGILLLRIVCGIALLCCVLAALAPFLLRGDRERPGWGCALLAIPVGWFAWVGMTMHY
jgi:hypothetical protein